MGTRFECTGLHYIEVLNHPNRLKNGVSDIKERYISAFTFPVFELPKDAAARV